MNQRIFHAVVESYIKHCNQWSLKDKQADVRKRFRALKSKMQMKISVALQNYIYILFQGFT